MPASVAAIADPAAQDQATPAPTRSAPFYRRWMRPPKTVCSHLATRRREDVPTAATASMEELMTGKQRKYRSQEPQTVAGNGLLMTLINNTR